MESPYAQRTRKNKRKQQQYQHLTTTQHTLVCSPSSDVKIDNLQLEANTYVPVVPGSSGLDSTFNKMKKFHHIRTHKFAHYFSAASFISAF
jgi:hypothetical protein